MHDCPFWSHAQDHYVFAEDDAYRDSCWEKLPGYWKVRIEGNPTACWGLAPNFNELYDMVQARIDTGLDLQCFPDRMTFWQGTVTMKEVVCVLSVVPKSQQQYANAGFVSTNYY